MTAYVDGERYSIGSLGYDLSIYQDGCDFFASWHCLECSVRVESEHCPSKPITHQAAIDAIQAHHAKSH
jgi:hypothetical protein